MRERINDKSRLEHILNSIETIQSNKDRFTFEQLVADPIAYYGFVKCVEIIGEAVYMLSKEFRSIHPEVEWNVIENMRHVLVHGYYSIRLEQLWETIEVDIPQLKPEIEHLYQEETDGKKG